MLISNFTIRLISLVCYCFGLGSVLIGTCTLPQHFFVACTIRDDKKNVVHQTSNAY